jgi:hypothetical protein
VATGFSISADDRKKREWSYICRENKIKVVVPVTRNKESQKQRSNARRCETDQIRGVVVITSWYC